ncbi:uncharacterized protein At2g33490-like [Rutidosis leptorrhynchoides]|uniref:uncharacterized protein At2g33490-like n=1 Tax=Rutidosis leptorrhynchoides TaxID=125765 RepID=UPI003A9A4351
MKMKSSIEKLGRKLTMHRTERRDHQTSNQLDELVQASKDMQDIRNCYDGLISAAAAMTNSIFEFSESLHEVGMCLQDKTIFDADGESGRVLSTLGNTQSELQKIADIYRSYVIVTITNPSESLLAELRKVEEMKLQCDGKREAYEYMVSQHKEKGKLKSGKAEISEVQEAQDEYKEMARMCVFRVKSLKEGQCRSLLTQATRHHAAQLDFFRKGLKALEAVDPIIRIVAEKHRIDYQLIGLTNGNNVEGELMNSYENNDEGELSFDYRRTKQGIDNVAASLYTLEVDRPDIPHLQVPTLEEREINYYKHQGDFGKHNRVSSYSAPLYPDKVIDSSERPKEAQAQRKFHSYVLPSPVDAKSPISKTPTSLPQTNPFTKLQNPLSTDHEKHITDSTNDNNNNSSSNNNNNNNSNNNNNNNNNNNTIKRQAYSGPLLQTKAYSGKIASTTEIPHTRRSVSPPPLLSPRISELHELPRPPPKPAVASGGGSGGHSGPLLRKNSELLPTNRGTSGSILPPPPLVVSRSYSVHSSNPSAMFPKRVPSSQITGEVISPPLTPILLSNMKSTSRS